jgi:hypothetical protein
MGTPAEPPTVERRTASMAAARAELFDALGDLRGAVRDQLDWRGWVRRSPLVAIAVAAALGWRLGRGRWL